MKSYLPSVFRGMSLRKLIRYALAGSVGVLVGLLSTAVSVQAQSFTLSKTFINLTATIGAGSSGGVEATNQTNAPVWLRLTLEGPDASAFQLGSRMIYLGSGTLSDSIKTRGIGVEFWPISYKVHHALIVVTDSNGSADTIWLTGNGVPNGPYLYIHGNGDSVGVGNKECNDLVVKNGDPKLPVTISKLSLGTTDAGFWTTQYITLNDSNVTFPVTLDPGDSLLVQWCFAPTVKGFYFADSVIVDYTSSVGLLQQEAAFLEGKSTPADAPDSERVIITGPSADTLDFGTLPPNGASGTKSITFTNPSIAECEIVSVTINGSQRFRFTAPTLPNWIYFRGASVTGSFEMSTSAADSDAVFSATATIHTQYKDAGITQFDKQIVLIGRTGHAIRTTPDTLKLELAPDSSEGLDFSDTTAGCRLVEIANNSSDSLKIDTLYMKSGAHFEVEYVPTGTNPDSTFPALVRPHTSVYAYVCLLDSGQSSYDDTLVIVTEHALTSLSYAIHWQLHPQQEAVSYTAGSAPLQLSINPNPASSSVKLSFAGVRDASVEILDLLGRTVASGRTSSGAFQWNGRTLTGGLTAKGAYIARVTGRSSAGALVTLSQRVMIVR